MRSSYQRPVEYQAIIQGPRIIGVVGARSLSYQYADHVGQIVDDLIGRGNHIATGGAIGTDEFALCRLLRTGHADNCTVFAAWKGYEGFPAKVRASIRQFKEYGGHIVWGPAGKNEALVKTALLMRNIRLVDACYGLVAFITGDSRGTVFTIKKAAAKRKPLVVFAVDCDFPEIQGVKWQLLRCGGIWEGAAKAVHTR